MKTIIENWPMIFVVLILGIAYIDRWFRDEEKCLEGY